MKVLKIKGSVPTATEVVTYMNRNRMNAPSRIPIAFKQGKKKKLKCCKVLDSYNYKNLDVITGASYNVFEAKFMFLGQIHIEVGYD